MGSNDKKENLILSGNGEVGGGIFDRVIINGNGTINGDIECTDFECNGSAKINGDIKARTTVIKGNTKVRGGIESDHIEIQGNASVGGTVLFENLEVRGNANLRSDAKGEDLLLEGMVKIGGACEAETAKINGAITIEGPLHEDVISIQLHGRSKIKEIGGGTIEVKRENGVFLGLDKWIKSLSKELHADLIEGDSVNLEYTKAKVVRGKKVNIGPGCEIENEENIAGGGSR